MCLALQNCWGEGSDMCWAHGAEGGGKFFLSGSISLVENGWVWLFYVPSKEKRQEQYKYLSLPCNVKSYPERLPHLRNGAQERILFIQCYGPNSCFLGQIVHLESDSEYLASCVVWFFC